MTLMLVGGDVARGSCGRHKSRLTGLAGTDALRAGLRHSEGHWAGRGGASGKASQGDAETLCRLHVHVQPTG